MVLTPVSQLKPGDCLENDVHTMLGGVLMHKGRMLSVRDLDVLDAFSIKSVAIVGDSEAAQAKISAAAAVDCSAARISEPTVDAPKRKDHVHSAENIGFVEAWMQMVNLLKNVYHTLGTSKIPILELRQQMEWLLDCSKDYSPIISHPQIKVLLQGDMTEYLYHKSIAVALTSYLLGQWSSFPAKEGMQIALAGLLHDIGKAKVDADIWNKKGSLTERERVEMRRHTHYGYELLRNVPALNDGVKLAALQHHERMDGSGYPLGIKGEQIHPYAKIVAIADMFHAMTQNRVYQKASSPFVVLEQLNEESFGKLNPELVQIFIHKVTQMHQGAFVKLSDGRVGRIVFTESGQPTRPWVSADGQIIQLVQERHIWIDEVIGR
ncbi:HD-GYP domain-containing protein [Paenibacillus apiarius]|uniref:HD-GYP domain-containing protein n=1 Tax=Paenibacillus apiarius TaxID=46240 RepID=A0ABT4DYW6_9BACL|nr:HD-GYP domain-containing protein [Paenibacillus apiarius]MCY9514106.1 HD-GYP domain-containing protein [Paenibacillus apiarius]MCY9522554.1 HD-GYP domain-containing protein [Paenibacillus apiarius]MCY9552980.1 HD-GYP domain-containing protein [Paenibacillus apiarius]MCY9556379.1 HD-GYP domain-containing protein [Paenibacillus apiarius]MCY9686435.1 HD-GYP domain-containing protein [Paenibacillus apiarius]